MTRRTGIASTAGGIAMGLVALGALSPASAEAAVSAGIRDQTLIVNGDAATQRIALRLSAGEPTQLEIDLGDNGSAEARAPRAAFTKIAIRTAGGADTVRIDDSRGRFTDTESTVIDGGPGDDSLTGGAGPETLVGGDGSDAVRGGIGNDALLLGAQNDRAIWGPGEGSDTIEGQAGDDRLEFAGSNAAEIFDIAANGRRVRLTRNVGAITMDLDGVERIATTAAGGVDALTVHDVTATALIEVDANLAAVPGVAGGDGARDRVVVEGTSGADSVQAAGVAGDVVVTGLKAAVRIRGAETNDSLAVNSVDGADTVSAAALPAAAIGLTVDAGAGNDAVTGSPGPNVIVGGAGADQVTGGPGNDTALLGADDDRFAWNPGDGSDTLEGQAGFDRLAFNGSGAGEIISVTPNGARVRLTRNVAAITMDLAGVERIDAALLGGADIANVADLTGTELTRVDWALGADAQADRVNVTGTNGADGITLFGDPDEVFLAGLRPVVHVTNPEAALDTLAIDTLGGADTVDTDGLPGGTIRLEVR